MNRRIIYPFIFFTGMILPLLSNSQSWDCSISSTYKDQMVLKLNLNGGISSYFGDLSIYDLNPDDKVTIESLPAYSVIATLRLTNTFSISGQLLQANLKASKDTVSYKTQIFEYNIHGRVNFLYLFGIPHNPDFGFEGYVGIGQFFYNVTKQTTYPLYTDRAVYPVRVPEFVYFFGGGVSYRINRYAGITLDLALRQCQTDRLDEYKANNDFDYYAYLSFGVTIDVGRLMNLPPKTRYKLK